MLARLAEMQPESVEFRCERQRVVERCLPMADQIARRFDGRGEIRDDLVQVARIGLLKAIARFDVGTDSGFAAFAVPTIRGEILRYFRDSMWSVSVSRRYKDIYPSLERATSSLSQRLGRTPKPSELAAELGIDCRQVRESLAAGNCYRALSLENIRDRGWAAESLSAGTDSAFDQVECRAMLRPALAALPESLQIVVNLRFFESLSQSQIAERLGVSQTHVSRLLAKSLTALRRSLERASA